LQAERYAAGVRRFDFDAGMAPYDLASYASWQALTGHITPVSAGCDARRRQRFVFNIFPFMII